MKKLLLSVLIFPLSHMAFGQSDWDLERCVNYALEHNISVRQADVQSRLSALQLKQSKAMQIPTLGFNTQGGYNFGRSINPTTNEFTTNTVLFQSYGVQSGVTLFNFFNVKNSIKSAKAQSEADKTDIDRVKSDVTLNVAAAYLQYLQSLEQVNIAKGQIDLAEKQLDLTKKQVAAGSVPELNAAQLESQLSTDSSTMISNQATMNQNKLQLLALLDLSADTDFDVSLPDVENIPLEPIAELQPKDLYQIALINQYQQKEDVLKIAVAQYAAKSARAQMYPTLSVFGSVSSNYSNQYTIPKGQIPFADTVVNLNIEGKNYYQIENGFLPVYGKAPYGKQIFNINLSQAVGLTLNIPIFNNRQYKTA
ncbi:MAG TPA: TolC family protein, partial [Arachidicoccus sp.]